MGNKKIASKEISNKRKLEVESTKLDKKTFKRIDEQFQRYWRYLFGLIFIYVISYIFWVLILSVLTRNFLDSRGWGGEEAKKRWFIVLGAGLIQGTLFCMDGFVTALLKSPFNQMCYAINKAEGISYKKKDSVITKATESNEHCKETLKKFGILTISVEIIRIIVNGARQACDKDKYGEFWILLNVSYLIPLLFGAYRVWQIRNELNKLKKSCEKGVN